MRCDQWTNEVQKDSSTSVCPSVCSCLATPLFGQIDDRSTRSSPGDETRETLTHLSLSSEDQLNESRGRGYRVKNTLNRRGRPPGASRSGVQLNLSPANSATWPRSRLVAEV